MSASREKKTRRDMAVNGIPDPKKVREEEERAKHRRTNMIYGIIAGVFVLVAAFLLLWNTKALTLDGTTYTAADVDYYYYGTLSRLRNDYYYYVSYLGLDSSFSPSSVMNSSARSLLGVTDENMTWDSYLKGKALESLKYVTKLSNQAQENGYTFTEEMQKDLDEQLASLKENAKSNGMSENRYLKAVYGNNMSKATFVKMFKQNAIASAYSSDHQDSLTYTESDLEDYYKEHKDDLDRVSYELITFEGDPETKKDDDGKTIDPTDEEKAAAKEAAHTAATEALERYNAGEILETIAKDYDIATYSKEEQGTYSTSDMGKWLFDASRKTDEITLLESDPDCSLVLFHSRGRTEARTIDVRHILFLADTSELDSKSETYDADVQAIKDAAKAKADEALANWKAGEATEDSFAAMANELSEDPGSNTNGGLYEKVYECQMVTTFNDWCFDESRQVGDTDVVETSYGYHVMYFVGDNVPYWQMIADNALRSADQNEWLTELIKDIPVTQHTGMKYVG